MAIDTLSKLQIVGISEETISGAWGTPKTATTQYKRQLYEVGQSAPDFGKNESQLELTGAYSEMEEQARYVSDAVSGLKRIPFSGYATLKNISDHLMAAFQDLYGSEGASTPYTKMFNCGDSQIDFAAGEGVTFSVAAETNHGDVPVSIPDGIILENAVIDSLTLSIMPNASGKDKYMKMNGVWVGREMQTEQNFSSVWLNEDGTSFSSSYSPKFYNVGDSISNWFRMDAADLADTSGNNLGGCFRKFEMTLNNNITSDCVTTGGKPNNYKRNRTLTFSIDLPYNNATYKAVKGYKDGSSFTLSNFTNGTAYIVSGGLLFQSSIMKLTAQPFVFEGDYVAIRLEFKALRPNAGYVGVIGLSDAIDKGW